MTQDTDRISKIIRLHGFPESDEQDVTANSNARSDDNIEKQKLVPHARAKLCAVGILTLVDIGIIAFYRSIPMLNYEGTLDAEDIPFLVLISLQAVLGLAIFKYLIEHSTDRVKMVFAWLAGFMATFSAIGWVALATGNELKLAYGTPDATDFSLVPTNQLLVQLVETLSLGENFVRFMIDMLPVSLTLTNLIFFVLPIAAALLASDSIPKLEDARKAKKRLSDFETTKASRDANRDAVQKTRAKLESKLAAQANLVKQAGINLANSAEEELAKWDKMLIARQVLSVNDEWDGHGDGRDYVLPVGTPGGAINVDDPGMLARIIEKARKTVSENHISQLFDRWQSTVGDRISEKVVFVSFDNSRKMRGE